MTVMCKKLCPTAEKWKSEFGTDPDLCCLDCLLDDHMDGYPEDQKRGFLEIEKKDV